MRKSLEQLRAEAATAETVVEAGREGARKFHAAVAERQAELHLLASEKRWRGNYRLEWTVDNRVAGGWDSAGEPIPDADLEAFAEWVWLDHEGKYEAAWEFSSARYGGGRA